MNIIGKHEENEQQSKDLYLKLCGNELCLVDINGKNSQTVLKITNKGIERYTLNPQNIEEFEIPVDGWYKMAIAD